MHNHAFRVFAVLMLMLGVALVASAGDAPAAAAPGAGDAAAAAPFAGKKSVFEGYDRYDFAIDGGYALVICPKQAAAGKPWILRSSNLAPLKHEALGFMTRTDLALAEKGFHVVYMYLGDTYGAPEAVKHWDALYAEMQKRGLAKKTALMGVSREGLAIYRWAAMNTDKVTAIYGDNAVCDFKSWPGGKFKGSGDAGGWRTIMALYKFKNEQEAMDYKQNPIDLLKPLAEAKIALLHTSGDKDTVVPYEENAGIIKERYEKLGGSVTVIIRKGAGHHPHGLEDPTPVVDFMLAHVEHAE